MYVENIYIYIYIYIYILDTHIRFYSIAQVSHSITVPWMWHSSSGPYGAAPGAQHASHAIPSPLSILLPSS